MVFKRLDRICQDVIGRMNTDEIMGGSYWSASPEEELIDAEAPTRVTDTSEGDSLIAHGEEEVIVRRDHVSGMGKGKPRTRSRDGWIVKPPKGTPGRTGAKSTGTDDVGVTSEPSRPKPPILTVINGRCGPILQSSRAPSAGIGPHLVLIWNAVDHGSSEPSHAIGCEAR